MNLLFVYKGAKMYSVLTQITLQAIFAILGGIILPFSKDALFFRFLYFQKEHVQIAHVLSRSNKVKYKMYILCSGIISLISINMSNAKKKDNNNLLYRTYIYYRIIEHLIFSLNINRIHLKWFCMWWENGEVIIVKSYNFTAMYFMFNYTLCSPRHF